MNGKLDKKQITKRNRGNKPLAQIARSLLGPIFRKQGFARQEIVTRWESIVGPSLSAYSQPERISFPRNARQGGTLFIRVEGAFALEVQHRQIEILERLNTYFGYGAVEKIVIRQGPLSRKPHKKGAGTPVLSLEEQNRVDEAVTATKDDRLKSALKQVGQRVISANEPQNKASMTGKPPKGDD